MDIRQVRENWNRFGESDPLWAILTAPDKKGGRWDTEEFFSTGRAEVSGVMQWLASLPVTVRRNRALDFGCGVGRLTQALCEHFEECHGVDIAASMIEHARAFNRFGVKAVYHLHEQPDLTLFENGTFDFVYSARVLQHMRPAYHQAYIRESLRALRSGGVAVFQLPAGEVVAGQPLPPSGFSARIEMGPAPGEWLADAHLTLSLRVKNLSDATWPAEPPTGRHAIHLGNHWWDCRGRPAAYDDGRTPLPYNVRPGEEVVLPLTVRVPAVNGHYILEFDMVHESVAWFQQRGSATTRVRVKVTGGRWSRMLPQWICHFWQPQLPPEPVMEMYGTPKEEVIALVEAAGGRVVGVQQNDDAGPGWISFRYCVMRTAPV